MEQDYHDQNNDKYIFFVYHKGYESVIKLLEINEIPFYTVPKKPLSPEDELKMLNMSGGKDCVLVGFGKHIINKEDIIYINRDCVHHTLNVIHDGERECDTVVPIAFQPSPT